MVYTSSLVRIEGGSIIVESSRQIAADTSLQFGMEVASALPRRRKRTPQSHSTATFKATAVKQRRRKR